MPLRIVIVVPPLREKVSFYPPFGALSVMSAAREDGHCPYLLDCDAGRRTLSETVKQISELSPDVVGISAVVSTAYDYVKKLSFLIRQKMPDVLIVVGGGLSAAAETVLAHTAVDVAVYGEGEVTFKELLKKFREKKSFTEVKGISFKSNNKVIRNQPRDVIKNLDSLPFPDYDLLDLDKYILNMHDFINQTGYGIPEKIDKRIFETGRSQKFLRINISRGCVNKCTFCYRCMPGIRIHSLKYIGDLIEHVVTKYDIGHISFGDECFGPSKEWLWDFIRMIRERKFDLTYHVTGMRVSAIDESIMSALKEIGVWHIQFGFESGSQKILNIMEKNTRVEQNIKAALLAKKTGINTIPFVIIGYPGETTETLSETIDFLKKAELISETFRPTFPMAMPGTPLYEYAQLMGYINDEHKYLQAISNLDTTILSEDNYFINYTRESDATVLSWLPMIRNEINKYYNKSPEKVNKAAGRNPAQRFTDKVKAVGLINCIELIFNKIFKKAGNTVERYFHANKKSRLQIDFAAEGESLRKINVRLREMVSRR